MTTRTWRRLAEALGMQDEGGLNYQKLARQKQMQRNGTQSGRDRGDPLALMRQQQRQQAAAQPPNMTPRPGGLSGIPAGTDRPGQGNPLMAPPKRAGGLSQAANSTMGNSANQNPSQSVPSDPSQQGNPQDHGQEDPDWLDMLYGDDSDDE